MKFKTTLALLLSFVATQGLSMKNAAAEEEKVTSILYTCNLSFKASGRSIYIGIGYTDVHGSGTISCYDLLTGATEHVPVKVTARGPGAGLGVTGLTISGVATGVGVSKGPEELVGRYAMVRGNAAVGVGAAVGASLRLSKGAVSIDLAIEGQSGLGAGVDLLWVNLERDGESRIEAPKAPAAQASANQVPVTINATKTIYLSEGQPLQIVDSRGRLLQTIYLKPAARQ